MDLDFFPRLLASLVFVLSLIGLFAWALRRFGPVSRRRPAGVARRLEIVEVAALDARRRLVLIRRDDTEHLVLLGINADLLIESGITRTGRRFAQHLEPDPS